MSCTLGPLVEEAKVAAGGAYEICEADPSGLQLTANDLLITEESSWCQGVPTYTVQDVAGYLPTIVTQVKDIVYDELWANLQSEIGTLATNAAMTYSTKLERVTGDTAMAGQLEASYAQWASGSSALASSVQTALASQNYALSQQILETKASLDGKITANSEFYQTSLASVGETMAASGVLNSVTLADGSKVVSGFRSQASSETGSEFTIFADTFKILNRVPNGSGGYDYSSVVAPFTVQNDTVYIGAVNTSEPQITYLGEFASAPSTAGLDKNVVYKNTADGNTYLYNGTEWTIWIPAAEGQGVVSAFIFTRSAKRPDTPSGGSWTSMLPTSLNVTFGGSSADADGATGIVWSDGVPADNGKPLWTATKWFTSDNQPPYEGPMWNAPTVLADTPKQNFQWNTSLGFPGDPGPTGTSNGWTDSAIGAVWIAGSTTFNHATQSWSNWSIAKVKGEDGVDGIDGSDGAAGSRGSAILNYSTNLGSVAATAVGSATLAGYWNTAAPSWQDNEIAGDVLILTNTNTSSGWTNIYTYNGTVWENNTKLVVNGDAVINGTLSASALVSGGTISGQSLALSGGNSWTTSGTMYVSTIAGCGSITSSNQISCRNLHTYSSGGSYSAGISATGSSGTGIFGSGNYAIVADNSGSFGFWTAGTCWFEGAAYPFTGAHIGVVKEQYDIGDIMIAVDSKLFSIDQNVPTLTIASVAKDRRVFGVLSRANRGIYEYVTASGLLSTAIEGTNGEPGNRVVKPEYIPIIEQYTQNGYYVGHVNAIGEGGINVCSENGNIEAGDYICSSNTPGKGMKQDDDLLHNYTVAKALESVDWSKEESTTKMIACTYHCG